MELYYTNCVIIAAVLEIAIAKMLAVQSGSTSYTLGNTVEAVRI